MEGRQRLVEVAAGQLSTAGQVQIATGIDMLDATERQLEQIRRQLVGIARHVRGAKTLTDALYGVGPITALALTCWLGGADRFSSARKAVRFVGLDVTVYSSAGKRSPGHLSRQGPPVLRRCLYEAGKTHALGRAPDHGYYAKVKDRIDGKRARCRRPARSSGTPATSSPISVRTPSSRCDLTVWSPQRLRNGAGSGAIINRCAKRGQLHPCVCHAPLTPCRAGPTRTALKE